MKKKIVIFTGAGMSAESGLQTFRDSGGLWEGYNVQEVATPGAWASNPGLVLQFYNERRSSILLSKPNKAHEQIALWENDYDIQIITQNIDDLHERAGSKNILHLHGEIFKMRSERNDKLIYPIKKDILLGDLAEDGAQLRPHIVWFEEPVPLMEQAIQHAYGADIFVVIGTSLVVYPAASIIHYLPPFMPFFVLDKKVPKINRAEVTYIEKPASEGIMLLDAMLKKLNH